MLVIDEIRQRARLIVGPILGVTLVVYFAYHLVQGDRGLLAWLRLSQQINEAHQTLDQIKTAEAPLAEHIALMRNRIDPDLLDQQVRATLDLIGPNEVVVFKSSPGTSTAPAANPMDLSATAAPSMASR